jgi:hypothetical protein
MQDRSDHDDCPGHDYDYRSYYHDRGNDNYQQRDFDHDD